MTVDAEGVITAKKTISIIFGASAERYAIWLILIRISDINGTRSILRKVTKYTLLLPKTYFKSIPAKTMHVTIMLAGPIILPTEPIVSLISCGR